MQSSISSWLKKPTPPPPKASSAPSRAPSATTPAQSPAMENWNDIPDDFLQPPSRPRSKKSPRSSRAVTPSTSRVPTPLQTPPTSTLPQLFALRPLPPNVELAPLTQELLPSYKRLNALTLPVAYPESFYKETMAEPNLGITLVALWHPAPLQTKTNGMATNGVDTNGDSESEPPRLVGAIRCRLLPSSQLYISTIAILGPYRSHGIAMHLLQSVVKKAVELHSVKSVTAHVWEANEEGLEWYKKRNFEVLEKEEGYYRKLRPQGAHLVRKWIGVSDLLPEGVAADGPAR